MENDKLYRLMDVIDEIKQLDNLISKHHEQKSGDNSIMLDQYNAKKEQLLTYFINELNAFSQSQSSNLFIIKRVMERFYNYPSNSNVTQIPKDDNLSVLYDALSA